VAGAQDLIGEAFGSQDIVLREDPAGQKRCLERRSGKASFLDLPEPKRKTDTDIEFLGTVGGLFRGVCWGALLWGITIMVITLFVQVRT